MYERFTARARRVMHLANQEAQQLNHEYIGTEHILLGLISTDEGTAIKILQSLGMDLEKIRMEVRKLVVNGIEIVTGQLPKTPRAKKVIEFAMEEVRNLKHEQLGTGHFLLGLLREQEGVAAQVLMNLGLKIEEVRDEVIKSSNSSQVSPELDLDLEEVPKQEQSEQIANVICFSASQIDPKFLLRFAAALKNLAEDLTVGGAVPYLIDKITWNNDDNTFDVVANVSRPVSFE
jgi:ATP-dependent Clp protease ATP-binding subunit ClpA